MRRVNGTIGLILLLGIVLAAVPSGISSQPRDTSGLTEKEETLHLISPTTQTDHPITSLTLTKRIQDAAQQYAPVGPLPRAVLFDIAYPSNQQEYEDMSGFSLMLVTAISQTEAELPIARLYAVSDADTTNLTLLSSVVSRVDVTDTLVRQTFGRYRVDALYLLPTYLRLSAARLVVDFAVNRKDFTIGDLSGDLAKSLKKMRIHPPAAARPAGAALLKMIKREYPGFVSP